MFQLLEFGNLISLGQLAKVTRKLTLLFGEVRDGLNNKLHMEAIKAESKCIKVWESVNGLNSRQDTLRG